MGTPNIQLWPSMGWWPLSRDWPSQGERLLFAKLAVIWRSLGVGVFAIIF